MDDWNVGAIESHEYEAADPALSSRTQCAARTSSETAAHVVSKKCRHPLVEVGNGQRAAVDTFEPVTVLGFAVVRNRLAGKAPLHSVQQPCR